MCPDQGSSLFSARLITNSSNPPDRSRSIRATAACRFRGSSCTGRRSLRVAARRCRRLTVHPRIQIELRSLVFFGATLLCSWSGVYSDPGGLVVSSAGDSSKKERPYEGRAAEEAGAGAGRLLHRSGGGGAGG